MSEMPTLSVSASDPTPPYEQLRRQLVILIDDGVLRPGSRLPPVRQLAGDLGLAAGTVARTYRELEAAGLIVTRRGGGTRVADHAPVLARDAGPQAVVRHAAEEYVRRARSAGASRTAIMAALHEALDGAQS